MAQTGYIDSIPDIEISRNRARGEESATTREEYEEYRTGLGMVAWVAGVSAPVVAYDMSTLARSVNKLLARHLKLLQKCIKKLKHYRDGGLAFLPFSAHTFGPDSDELGR